jgi:large subunit ribosomal protein L3
MNTLGILGKKIGMTRIFDEAGNVVPVTVIQAGPCPVLQVKRHAGDDGYSAIQLGFGTRREKLTTKPLVGHFKKAGAAPQQFVREIRLDDVEGYEVGKTVDIEIFEVGEKVDVTGVSKGRGFAGPMKRHHSSRGPESHGSMYHRRPGSMGASADPSHVFKGKKLAGHMGAVRSTTQNMKVVGIDKENHLLLLNGSVPGHANGFVMIRKSKKAARKAARR